MIVIKYRFFIIIITALIIYVGIFTIYSNVKLTPDEKLEKIIEEQEEDINDFETLPSQEDNESIERHDEIIKEAIRFNLSNKLKQTIQFFFSTKLNVVAIGDSLTEGVGDPTGEGGYIGILNRMINDDNNTLVNFYNYGKRGTRSDQLLNIIDEPEIKNDLKNADIILMSIGANDVMQIFKENFTKLTLTPFITEELEYELRLQKLLTKIRKMNKNAHIYLLGFYNPFGQHFEEIEELNLIINNWNAIGENVTNQLKNSSFIPIKDLFDNDTNMLLADDFFHPNYEGYRKIAERVLLYIIEEGDEAND